MSGWIAVHKSMLDWEWYSDTSVFRLFMHCLLAANHEVRVWKGMEIARGQLVVGRDKLASTLDMSPSQLRTAERKLETCGSLEVKTTNKFTVYTVVNYDDYQSNRKQAPNKSQSNNKPIATPKQYNKLTSSIYIPDWLPADAWSEFVIFRKAINAQMTEHAEKLAIADLDKLRQQGHSPVDVINQSIKRNWKGLFPIKGDDNATTSKLHKQQPARKDPASTAYDKAQSIIARRNAAAGIGGGSESTHPASATNLRLPEDLR